MVNRALHCFKINTFFLQQPIISVSFTFIFAFRVQYCNRLSIINKINRSIESPSNKYSFYSHDILRFHAPNQFDILFQRS